MDAADRDIFKTWRDGQSFRYFRIAAGLSITELARRIAPLLDRPTEPVRAVISYAENGRRQLAPEVFEAACDVLIAELERRDAEHNALPWRERVEAELFAFEAELSAWRVQLDEIRESIARHEAAIAMIRMAEPETVEGIEQLEAAVTARREWLAR